MSQELGQEECGNWTYDPDVQNIQRVLKKYGVFHSKKVVYQTWGDFCQQVYHASWASPTDYADEMLFAIYYAFFNGLVACTETESVLVDIITRLTAPAVAKDTSATTLTELEVIRNRPWSTLALSTRAYNCIRRAAKEFPIQTIGDLADLHYSDTYRIRHCGTVTRKEIADALRELGIEKSGWYR